MSDKKSPRGATAAIVAVVGACSLCALGPAFFASVVAAASGWFTGLVPVFAIGLGLVVAFLVRRLWSAWRQHDNARPNASAREAR
jgi:CHASE2 domain-containing sensor protein